MNKGQIISSIRNILLQNKELFDSEIPLHLPPSISPVIKEDSLKIQYFYYPKQISPDVIDGYRLKNDQGFISFAETYKFINNYDLEKISFVYRYVTSKFIYECRHSEDKLIEKKSLYYNFHYDLDLTYKNPVKNDFSNHPPIHLQVLHPHPRFPVLEDMNIQLFLDTVRSLCFKNKTLDPYEEPIYSIRHIPA